MHSQFMTPSSSPSSSPFQSPAVGAARSPKANIVPLSLSHAFHTPARSSRALSAPTPMRPTNLNFGTPPPPPPQTYTPIRKAVTKQHHTKSRSKQAKPLNASTIPCASPVPKPPAEIAMLSLVYDPPVEACVLKPYVVMRSVASFLLALHLGSKSIIIISSRRGDHRHARRVFVSGPVTCNRLFFVLRAHRNLCVCRDANGQQRALEKDDTIQYRWYRGQKRVCSVKRCNGGAKLQVC